MATTSNSRKFPDKDIIEEIAIESGIDPSFIEKDWYTVQMINIITNFTSKEITPVFSGGTCLSKGYHLIKRFSEDIDFKIKTDNANITRALCKKFRENIIEQINSSKSLVVLKESIESKNESKFFSFNVEYLQIFPLHGSLRLNLKLEMSFSNIILPSTKKGISSLVTEYLEEEPENFIECISPIETAADKLSALIWRMEIKNRKAKEASRENDPTIIRHLYDLHALKDKIINNNTFIDSFITVIDKDYGRGGSDKNLSIQDKINYSLSQLNDDKEYKNDYNNFVDALFYGKDDERVTFNIACQSYYDIKEFILSKDLKHLSLK